ncbi:Nicotinamidase-related amidase [Microlunatus sagamiharensis]|uniref:Nicotinamidase-related amidase n=1 Tax=Microlunatus sagamiharensis TaxID=546874 RepID=A0A1H2MBB5_9ACTN|nr:isochorismatase family cysteine hydrolase [Microlunatus sagamiharensis]SDU90422.1 Nicotinamidase-related amidase [Microlunatus sagamiharensis]
MPLPSFDPRRTAVVTIDMHRGHLDPEVATMPLPAEAAARVTAANAVLVRAARARQVPVVHVVTGYHAVSEIASNPWWAAVAGTDATRANVLNHQLPGSPGLQVMPDLLDASDVVVIGKKRYDCFAATDLDHVLRSRSVQTLLLTGVNTNSCVLATTVAANTRDYAAVVVEECVDTMDRSLHDAALRVIGTAFGWVAGLDETVAAL